jgi:hypothetical protein
MLVLTILKFQVRSITALNEVEVGDVEQDYGEVVGSEERATNRVPVSQVALAIDDEKKVFVQVHI